jgi:hypothetical protein
VLYSEMYSWRPAPPMGGRNTLSSRPGRLRDGGQGDRLSGCREEEQNKQQVGRRSSHHARLSTLPTTHMRMMSSSTACIALKRT